MDANGTKAADITATGTKATPELASEIAKTIGHAVASTPAAMVVW